jgi:hypothetical protein
LAAAGNAMKLKELAAEERPPAGAVTARERDYDDDENIRDSNSGGSPRHEKAQD